jgi:hypothetical protein
MLGCTPKSCSSCSATPPGRPRWTCTPTGSTDCSAKPPSASRRCCSPGRSRPVGRASRKRAEQRRTPPSPGGAPAQEERPSSDGAPVLPTPGPQRARPGPRARRTPTRRLPPHARTGLQSLEELCQARRKIEEAIAEQVSELSRLGADWGVIATRNPTSAALRRSCDPRLAPGVVVGEVLVDARRECPGRRDRRSPSCLRRLQEGDRSRSTIATGQACSSSTRRASDSLAYPGPLQCLTRRLNGPRSPSVASGTPSPPHAGLVLMARDCRLWRLKLAPTRRTGDGHTQLRGQTRPRALLAAAAAQGSLPDSR